MKNLHTINLRALLSYLLKVGSVQLTMSFLIRMNWGQGRQIRNQNKYGVKIHRSVKLRMEADHLKGGPYYPKALLEVKPTWVT